MQNLPQEIKAKFNELPQLVQNTILNSGWEKTTRNIVEKYNLRIDQGAVIEEETMFVMFGFDAADKFTENIMREAKVDKDLAEKITTEINNNVFRLITDKLVEATSNNETSFTDRKDDFTEESKPHEPVISKREEEVSTNTVSKETIQTEALVENEPGNTNSLIEENLSRPEVQKPTSIDPYLEPIE